MSPCCHFTGDKSADTQLPVPSCPLVLFQTGFPITSPSRRHSHITFLPQQKGASRPQSICSNPGPGPLACEQQSVAQRQLGSGAPQYGSRKAYAPRGRKPAAAAPTFRVPLSHIHAEFLLRELGCVTIHIADPNLICPWICP